LVLPINIAPHRSQNSRIKYCKPMKNIWKIEALYCWN